MPALWNSPFPLVTTSALSFVSKKISTPTFDSKPRPETRIRLVGGPVFFEREMEGVARASPLNSDHARNRMAKKVTDCERSFWGLGMSPPRSSREWVCAGPAYLKRGHNLVPFPLVCQLRQRVGVLAGCLSMIVGEKSRF